jgi:ABC-2 type transport system ATP-binding protein
MSSLPSSRKLAFSGKFESLSRRLPFRQQFRYVPEEPYLYTRLSDLEYLMMVAQLGDMPRKTATGVEAEN